MLCKADSVWQMKSGRVGTGLVPTKGLKRYTNNTPWKNSHSRRFGVVGDIHRDKVVCVTYGDVLPFFTENPLLNTRGFVSLRPILAQSNGRGGGVFSLDGGKIGNLKSGCLPVNVLRKATTSSTSCLLN